MRCFPTRASSTDGRPHIGSGIREYLGDSRARWDGDDLVVETTNLTDQTAFGVNGNGPRHSTQMKVTERFRRGDDLLQYQITVDDPLTYERPFTVSMPLTPLEGGKASRMTATWATTPPAVAGRRATRGSETGGRPRAWHHPPRRGDARKAPVSARHCPARHARRRRSRCWAQLNDGGFVISISVTDQRSRITNVLFEFGPREPGLFDRALILDRRDVARVAVEHDCPSSATHDFAAAVSSAAAQRN